MIDNCINLSDEAIDALKDRIKSFDIKTVPDENVEFVTSRFLYAFKRLKQNHAVTTSLMKSLYKIFQTTSVPKFNDIIGHMERDVLINPNRKKTYEEFLREALAHYKALSHENKWNHPGQDGAVFNADGTKKYHQDRNTGRNDVPSPYCAPTQADKVKNDPECFRRQIKGN